MYNFIDVTETSKGVSLPSEALKINGEYIENQISGYRTLTVEGREALSPEVATFETGLRDGSTMKGKRYPARIIRITYQLIAATNAEFRDAYNKLAGILDVTDAELIFNDETDKYFIGTPSLMGEVPPGRNSVVGEFEILCLDPFKYSVVEHEVTPELNETSVIIDYQGTYKSFPKLEAEFYNEDDASEDGETVTALTGNGDCGYVAFFNEEKKIIQLGDPDEVDGEDLALSQTLFNQKFNATNSWGTAAKSLWKVNSGITSSSAVEQKGSIGMGVASYTESNTSNVTKRTLLKAISKAGHPYIHYKLVATATKRTSNSVQVTINIETRLDNSDSYFGRGYGLACVVSIGDTSRTVTLKERGEYWRGTTAHTKSFTVSVALAASAGSIGDVKFRAYRTDSTGGTAGTLAETACTDIGTEPYVAAEPEAYYLRPASFGSGSNWHGPSITRTIPADAAGVVGASNFTLQYSHRLSIGADKNDTYQLGAFQVLLVSGSGTDRKIVAGVNVYKGSSGKKAKLRIYLNNAVKETMDIDLSFNNKMFSAGRCTNIKKFGNKVTFNFGAVLTKTYVDANIADDVVTEVTFTFTQFGSKTPLSYNGLYWAKFVKGNCDTWKNVKNKFSANDVVVADCQTGEITLNGADAAALGALGNDWEGFCLTPGINQIGFSYSDWVAAAYAPSFRVKYREVFL